MRRAATTLGTTPRPGGACSPSRGRRARPAALGTAAGERAKTLFSWDHVTDEYVALLTRMLARRGRPRRPRHRPSAYPDSVLPQLIFWTSAGVLGWVYLGYPVVVATLAKVAPVRLRATGDAPGLCVAIAVHDEGTHITERIADVFAQEASGARLREVIVGSDGSTDDTDAVVRALARTEPRLRLIALPRGGQTATQSALFDAAPPRSSSWTDAETRFAPGCLAALAEPFRDPRSAASPVAWNGATRLRRRPPQRGAVLALRARRSRDGEPGRVPDRRHRRGAGGPPFGAQAGAPDRVAGSPPALYVREQGGLSCVPTASATDRPISGLREQFRESDPDSDPRHPANLSMVRTARAMADSQGVPRDLVAQAAPVGNAMVHRRGRAERARPGCESVARNLVAPGAILVGVVAAAGAHLLIGTGRRPPRVAAFARSFAVVCAAFALGWVNGVRGRRIDVWHRAEWNARL